MPADGPRSRRRRPDRAERARPAPSISSASQRDPSARAPVERRPSCCLGGDRAVAGLDRPPRPRASARSAAGYGRAIASHSRAAAIRHAESLPAPRPGQLGRARRARQARSTGPPSWAAASSRCIWIRAPSDRVALLARSRAGRAHAGRSRPRRARRPALTRAIRITSSVHSSIRSSACSTASRAPGRSPPAAAQLARAATRAARSTAARSTPRPAARTSSSRSLGQVVVALAERELGLRAAGGRSAAMPASCDTARRDERAPVPSRRPRRPARTRSAASTRAPGRAAGASRPGPPARSPAPRACGRRG